jgi:hypothetical protein
MVQASERFNVRLSDLIRYAVEQQLPEWEKNGPMQLQPREVMRKKKRTIHEDQTNTQRE